MDITINLLTMVTLGHASLVHYIASTKYLLKNV